MLPYRSNLFQFAGFFISISLFLKGTLGRDDLPSYAEFYNTKAANAIKGVNSNVGDLVQIASSHILKYMEADNEPEEAKQKQNYQTYEIPRETLAKFSLEGSYEDEIDALDREYSSPTVYKLDAVKVSDTQKEDPPGDYGSSSSEPKEQPNKSSYHVTKTKHLKPKKVPKQSSDEESYIPQYQERYYQVSKAEAPQVTEAPYKNYKSYTAKPTTSASNDKYRISANQNVGKSSDCEEVRKKSNDKEPEMKCVVCKDPKTGSKSEQCSYATASEPEAYFITKSEKFSQPQKTVNERYKRYAADDGKEFDPYEFFKAESQKHFSVDEGDFFKNFKFPSGYFSGDNLEKSESEIQTEKLAKEGGVCKEVKKNDMTCKVCKNEKTGGSFETCSYSSVPHEKKYAFVSEKKSDGSSEPKEKVTEGKDTKVVQRKFEPKVSETVKDEVKKDRDAFKSKLVDDNPYEVPKHFAEQTRYRGEKSHSDRYQDSTNAENKENHSNDEYYNKIFNKPEASEEKQSSYIPNNDRKDVEKVLEEFAKKDRSTCKKAVKNGMTCYLCVNKDGTQHEECMYVTGKQPRSSHIAYHEVEQIKSPAKENPATAASTVREVAVQKRKRPIKKAYSNTQAAPSVKVTTTAKFIPSSSTGAIVNGKFRQPRKLRRTQNYSGADAVVEEARNIPIVTQVKVPKRTLVDSEVAPSNSKYVYNKELGIRLPKYFLEQSEYEKSFNSRS
ncbi:hypothetical protein Trydic_g16225 [Trypoxylus dichotomus]